MKNTNSYSLIKLIPLVGICVFVVLYITAALLYPGGNYLDQQYKGFSVLHNYWCDLLNERAQNGQWNTSRPVAITGMIILCTSLIFFWWKVPNGFTISKTSRVVIILSGTLSMVIGMLIFTGLHNDAITYAGFFGGVAFFATILGLYKSKWYSMFWLGIFCLIIGTIMFTVYKTRVGIIMLPMIQKVTLALCLTWIGIIDWKLRSSK